MKKIIPFTNDIKFNTKIYEVTSISLEHNLKLKQDNIISGDFIVSGDYKITDTSINTEPFINSIPFEITLDNKYDIDNVKIDIDNFNYEVVNDEILKINISVKIDGVEFIDLEEDDIRPDVILEKNDDKEEIIDINEIEEKIEEDVRNKELNEIDLFKEESKVEKVCETEKTEVTKEVNKIIENFNEIEDEYVTYYVHIVRENDNIEEICNKYKVTKENIKEYNNLDEFMVGSKIIIPYVNESI